MCYLEPFQYRNSIFQYHGFLSSSSLLILATVFDTVNLYMLFPALADLKITESALAVLLPAWAHLSAINEESSVHTVDL